MHVIKLCVVGGVDVKSSILARQIKNYFACKVDRPPVHVQLMSPLNDISADPLAVPSFTVQLMKYVQEEPNCEVPCKRLRLDEGSQVFNLISHKYLVLLFDISRGIFLPFIQLKSF